MEISEILREFNNSPFVSCITSNELKKIADGRRSITLTRNNKLIGFAHLRKLNDKWYDIGPVYVLRRYRGKGNGKKLFKDVTNLIKEKGIYLIATTTNPAVSHVLISLGYRQIKVSHLPMKVLLGLVRKNNLSRLICYFKKGLILANWKTYLLQKT